MMTFKGIINGFSGSWHSGMGFLIIDGTPVPCDNAPTVRALDAAFGDVITDAHGVDNSAIEGREIVYSVDGMGMLDVFTPVEDWTGPEIPEEGLEEEA